MSMTTRPELRRLLPAPRYISPRIAAHLICSGPMATTGWVFFNLSLIFVFAFDIPKALWSILDYRSESYVEGRITAIEDTNTSINDETVQKVVFSFQLDGTPYTGTSYSTEPSYDVGEAAEVTLRGEDPASALLPGMTSTTTPGFAVGILMVFPVAGILLIFFGGRPGARRLRLLRRGRLAEGVFLEEKSTGIHVNDEELLELSFSFQVEGTTYYATGRTLDPGSIRDEAREPILYNPDNPDDAFPFDLVSDLVTIDPKGRMRPARHLVGLPGIAPVIAMTAIALFLSL